MVAATAERLLLPFAIGAVCAIALDIVAGVLHHDQRPFVMLGVAPLVAHDSDNGFPSDHSAAAAFIAVAALFIDVPLGVLAWVTAVALGVARLYCLLHSPVDVFAGWLIGATPALVAGLSSRARTPALRRRSRT
jgi:membrane-associated phospholipid phosphatase